MSLTGAQAAAEVVAVLLELGTDYTVTRPVADTDASSVEQTAEQVGVGTIRGIMDPIAAEAAFKLWALETHTPYRLSIKGEDGVGFEVGGTVSGGGLSKTLYIVGPPRILDVQVPVIADVLLDSQRPG